MFIPQVRLVVLTVCLSLACQPMRCAYAQGQDGFNPESQLYSGVPNYENIERSGNSIRTRSNVPADSLPLRLPRFFAPVKKVQWISADGTVLPLVLKPEIDEWLVASAVQLEGHGRVQVELDAPALLADQLEAIQAQADGTFYLPAHLARTSGKNLRYEPQPYKNTVGYWNQPSDYVTWTFRLDSPGTFNLAILQGCGKGQGGSLASLTLDGPAGSMDSQEFTVKETGHFQNFQWLQLQPIQLSDVGLYQLKIAPQKISKSALMDIRMVHLSKVPE